MDNEQESYINETVDYIMERVKSDNSISHYLKRNPDIRLDINDFIKTILIISEEFLDFADGKYEIQIAEDEMFYVVDKTGYSADIVRLVLWYKECYLMEIDCCMINGNCPECGFDELYVRETEGKLFETFIECGKCKKKMSYLDVKELLNADDEENDWDDDNWDDDWDDDDDNDDDDNEIWDDDDDDEIWDDNEGSDNDDSELWDDGDDIVDIWDDDDLYDGDDDDE